MAESTERIPRLSLVSSSPLRVRKCVSSSPLRVRKCLRVPAEFWLVVWTIFLLSISYINIYIYIIYWIILPIDELILFKMGTLHHQPEFVYSSCWILWLKLARSARSEWRLKSEKGTQGQDNATKEHDLTSDQKPGWFVYGSTIGLLVSLVNILWILSPLRESCS